MKTELHTNWTVGDICKGFIFDRNENKGLFGLDGQLIIQPEYQRNYIYGDGKRDVAVVQAFLGGRHGRLLGRRLRGGLRRVLLLVSLRCRRGLLLAHELDLVHDHLKLGSALAVLVPARIAQLALDGHLGALGQVLVQAASPIAEHGAVNEVRIILPFAGLAVLAAVVHCDAETHHRVAGSSSAYLGLAGEVARYDNAVDRHDELRSLMGGDSFRSPFNLMTQL